MGGGTPPSPRSFGIIGLGGKSRQVFGFKGLIGKVSRNKDLACQRALKMGLGQLRGPFWETDKPQRCPNQKPIVASGGWEVCDVGHRWFVMKEGRSQTQELGVMAYNFSQPGEVRSPIGRERAHRETGRQ